MPKGMSIENLPVTRDALFSQRVLSQPDSGLVTSQLAELSLPQPETKGLLMENDCFVSKLSQSMHSF